MKQRWVLDVLTDLKSFAAANDLAELAAHLEEARLIAAVELASKADEAQTHGHGQDRRLEPDIGKLG